MTKHVKVRIRPSATIPGWWYACHATKLPYTLPDGVTEAPRTCCTGAVAKTPAEAFNKLKEVCHDLGSDRH